MAADGTRIALEQPKNLYDILMFTDYLNSLCSVFALRSDLPKNSGL